MTGLFFLILALNGWCFALFARDKKKARTNQRRISENTLHWATLLLASPGAWAAIFLLHHKNRKTSFLSITLLITLLHVGGLYLVRHALPWPV